MKAVSVDGIALPNKTLSNIELCEAVKKNQN